MKDEAHECVVVSLQSVTLFRRHDEARAGSVHAAGVLEPHVAAVLGVEPVLAVGEAAGLAAGALSVVGAVKEGDVLVADVAEPGGRC
jgi:hypothetical protein